MQAWFEYQPARIGKPSGPASTASIRPPWPMRRSPRSTTTASARSRTTSPRSAASPAIGRCATDRISISSSRTSTAIRMRGSGRPSGSGRARHPRPSRLLPGGSRRDPRCGPRLQQRPSAGRDRRSARRGSPIIARTAPPHTILGATQKAWFLDRLRGIARDLEDLGQFTGRARLAQRSAEPARRAGRRALARRRLFEHFASATMAPRISERGEIYDLVRREGITGFAIVSGDRHSFWAGYAAKALPPKPFEPVGLAFITGSISSPGLVEALEHRFPRDHPLRPLFMADRPGSARPHATVNMQLLHGVRSCLEYARSGDLERARALSNPDLAPHLALRRHGRPRLCHRAPLRRRDAHRVRLHPPPARRRSRAPTAARCAIASPIVRRSGGRRTAAARAAGDRGRSGPCRFDAITRRPLLAEEIVGGIAGPHPDGRPRGAGAFVNSRGPPPGGRQTRKAGAQARGRQSSIVSPELLLITVHGETMRQYSLRRYQVSGIAWRRVSPKYSGPLGCPPVSIKWASILTIPVLLPAQSPPEMSLPSGSTIKAAPLGLPSSLSKVSFRR